MGRPVPALMRALDILELFLDGESHTVPEITRMLGLPRTTAHELVTTLATRRYLVAQADHPGHYRLGSPLFQLGAVFTEQLDLAREGRFVSERIAAECGETVHVAVLDGTDVLYVAKVDSSHPVRLVSAVGRRLPAHCTGVGKMLLAGLDRHAFQERYPDGVDLPAMTPDSITSPAELRAALDEVRERGVAYEYCESNSAAACVAAPVHDASREMVAAISISVPTARWNTDTADTLASHVRTGARELSMRLGGGEASQVAAVPLRP